MMPQDHKFFKTGKSKDWFQPPLGWFEQLAGAGAFSVAEKVHLARIALQGQWICDVKDTQAARNTIQALGLHVADEADGFLIVAGSEALGQYAAFRSHQLSLLEVGILYGYSPTAVIALSDILHTEPNQPWPTTAGEYFLGGTYSKDFAERERAAIAFQWSELEHLAPAITSMAEDAFLASMTKDA
jgi:hypothetical protein